METIAHVVAGIMLIAAITCGCMLAFLICWHFGKEDVKKYLFQQSNMNTKIKVKKNDRY